MQSRRSLAAALTATYLAGVGSAKLLSTAGAAGLAYQRDHVRIFRCQSCDAGFALEVVGSLKMDRDGGAIVKSGATSGTDCTEACGPCVACSDTLWQRTFK